MYKVSISVLERIHSHLKKTKKEMKSSVIDPKVVEENEALIKLLEDNYTLCKSK